MKRSWMTHGPSLFLSGLLFLACGDDTGTEGGPCYDNGTCDSGLVCLSKKCVDASEPLGTGGSEASGGSDSADSGGADGDGGQSGGEGGGSSGGASQTSGGGGAIQTGGAPSAGGSASGGGSAGGSDGDGGSAGAHSMGPVEVFDGDGVSIEAEDYDIVGNFFVLEDSVEDGELVVDPYLTFSDLDGLTELGASSDEPSSFDGASAPCVSGTIAVVTDSEGGDCELSDAYCDWTALWGGGIGLSLNQPEDDALAWDATAGDVVGFAFEISIGSGSPPLRFLVEDTSGKQYCTDIGNGQTEIGFDELDLECWDPKAGSLDPSKIKQVSWQFENNASNSLSIDEFCVESFSLLK